MRNTSHGNNRQPNYRLQWAVLAVGCIVALTSSIASAANTSWTAEGRRLPWQMSVPGDWFGGNYHQLSSVIESTSNEYLRVFFESFLPEVRGRDAALFHTPDLEDFANDATSFATETMSAIRIDVLPQSGELYEFLRSERDRMLVLQSYADTVRSEAAPGASAALVGTRSFVVDRRDAHEATYRVDLPDDRGRYYITIVFVMVRDGAVHLFTLEADSTRFSARRDELREMLMTLQYADQ